MAETYSKLYMTQLNTKIEKTRGENPSAFFDYYCKTIGDMAVRALLYEVSATPKPGLVDRENNGAHKDMCFETFIDSAASLRNCFEDCCKAGVYSAKEEQSVSELALNLRKIGLEGEKSMFEATGGVNTHKGLIFSLGVICGGLGLMLANAEHSAEAEQLQEVCRKISAELLGAEPEEVEETHGKKVLDRTGVGGIRAEALSGFNTAFSVGVPELERAVYDGCSINTAMVRTLIKLMHCVDDSNVVHRGGVEGLRFVKERAGKILASGDWWKDEKLMAVRDFDAQCIEKNLSPGGCADLLAISVMIFYLKKRGIL